MSVYSTDVEQTVAALFDNELVIANYGSGLYYAVSASGTLIWQGLQAGMTVPEVAAWLALRCPDHAAPITEDVPDFVATLAAECLVVEAERLQRGEDPAIPDGFTWATPRLERFDDLRELLLLDPVHDVKEAGWPHRAED